MLPKASSLVIGIAGLLFATHPIHTDAVTSIVGRSEMMSGTVSMLSFLVYSSAFKEHDRINADFRKIILSILLAGVAVMCKEQGITAIGINAAYDIVVVCGLDVPTFIGILFFGDKNTASSEEASDIVSATTPASDDKGPGTAQRDEGTAGNVADGSEVVSSDDHDLKQGRGRMPLYVRALLIRLAWLAVGLVIIMFFRLRMNKAVPIHNERTNRMRNSRFVFNLALFSCSCQQDEEAFPASPDQGLLRGISRLSVAVPKIPEL